MAIKGKKKKSGGRATAAAPRRPLVAPKPRLLERKGVQIAAGSLLALVIGLILGWAIWHGSSDQVRALTKAESARIAGAKGTIEAALTGVGRVVPPANFLAFPDLATGLDSFNRGKISSASFAKQAQQAGVEAKAASARIGGLDMTTIAKDLPMQTGVQLLTAQEDIKQALLLYEQSAQMLDRATTASGQERAYLISAATSLRASADELMSRGYKYYLLVIRAAGLQSAGTTGAPIDVSGLPGGAPSP